MLSILVKGDRLVEWQKRTAVDQIETSNPWGIRLLPNLFHGIKHMRYAPGLFFHHSSSKTYFQYSALSVTAVYLYKLSMFIQPPSSPILQVETLSCATRSHQGTWEEYLMWNQRWGLSLSPSLWTMNRTKGRKTLQGRIF